MDAQRPFDIFIKKRVFCQPRRLDHEAPRRRAVHIGVLTIRAKC